MGFWRLRDGGGPPIGLEVTWNGSTVFSETATGFQPYQHFTASVTGTGSDSLVFKSYNDPSYTYLDDVSLTAGVPEASTWVMLLLGFAGYRKQKALGAV